MTVLGTVDVGRAAAGAFALALDTTRAAGRLTRRRVTSLLERLGVASPGETEVLIRRVEALSRQVRRLEELKQR